MDPRASAQRRLRHLGVTAVAAIAIYATPATGTDTPGVWDSFPTATFDLRMLTKTEATTLPYRITDGDLECTEEVEADYTYVFNFFGDVSYFSELPSYCADTSGAAVQFGVGGQATSCHTVGRYDSTYDDQIWSLLDKSSDADPSKGVSLKYLDGDSCSGGVKRQLTLNVECYDHPYRLVSASESVFQKCAYEINVQSYYGCPQECPITSNGLCDGHGLCMMELNDENHGTPHCYCNTGRGGSDCSQKVHDKHTSSADSDEGSGTGVQIAFLIILLLIFFALVASIVYMTLQVMRYRKETTETYTAFNAMGTEEIELHNGASRENAF